MKCSLGKLVHASKSKRVDWIEILLLLLIASGGSFLLWRLTSHGIGVGNDSVVYIAGGKNIFNGLGYTWFNGDGDPRPINHYPPLYSFILGFSILLSMPPVEWARIMQLLTMGANILLFGLLVRLLSQVRFFSLLAGAIFLVSKEIIAPHSWVMSDSLFLLFSLLTLIGLVQYHRGKHERFSLAAASFFACMSFLTRYVGISLFVVILLEIMLREEKNWRKRWRDLAFPLTLCLGPIVLWLWRNYSLTRSLTNRILGWYPKVEDWWFLIAETITQWFLPGRVSTWIFAHPVMLISFMFISLISGGVFLWQRLPSQKSGRRWAGMILRWQGLPILLFVIVYMGAMLGSAWFSYPDPDFNNRTLSPVYIGFLVFFNLLLAKTWSNGRILTRLLIAVVSLTFIFFKVYSARYLVTRLDREGQGYMSSWWQNSKTIQSLIDLDPSVIYTDNIGAVYFFTGEYGFNIPLKYDSVTGGIRSDYRESYEQMVARMETEKAVLVLFNQSARLPEFAPPEELIQDMVVIDVYPDGAIYALDEQ